MPQLLQLASAGGAAAKGLLAALRDAGKIPKLFAASLLSPQSHDLRGRAAIAPPREQEADSDVVEIVDVDDEPAEAPLHGLQRVLGEWTGVLRRAVQSEPTDAHGRLEHLLYAHRQYIGHQLQAYANAVAEGGENGSRSSKSQILSSCAGAQLSRMVVKPVMDALGRAVTTVFTGALAADARIDLALASIWDVVAAVRAQPGIADQVALFLAEALDAELSVSQTVAAGGVAVLFAADLAHSRAVSVDALLVVLRMDSVAQAAQTMLWRAAVMGAMLALQVRPPHSDDDSTAPAVHAGAPLAAVPAATGLAAHPRGAGTALLACSKSSRQGCGDGGGRHTPPRRSAAARGGHRPAVSR